MRKWFLGGLISVLAVFVTLPVLTVGAVAANQTTSSTNPSGQGLEISPPVIELNADPGQTVTATIRVRNVAAGQLIAKGRADDFGAASSEDGQPKLLLDETGATRFSLKYWVQSVPDLRLAPQELKTTTVTIQVPKNAEPGGHFGVVRFTAVPPELEGTGVALSASVGTLILLKVSGEITNKLNVAEFSAAQKGVKHSFFEHGPVDFVVRLKNEGSVHEKATGAIEVTNVFGRKVGSVVVNERGGNVLPDSIRRFEQTLTKKRLFGYYTAKLKITYAGNKTLSGSLGFWVIPWKLIILGLIGIVALVMLLKIGIRRYNDHIIAQANKARRR